jgi:hypothetical protein
VSKTACQSVRIGTPRRVDPDAPVPALELDRIEWAGLGQGRREAACPVLGPGVSRLGRQAGQTRIAELQVIGHDVQPLQKSCGPPATTDARNVAVTAASFVRDKEPPSAPASLSLLGWVPGATPSRRPAAATSRQTSPRRIAQAAASSRLWTPSFAKMCWTWFRTVAGLT